MSIGEQLQQAREKAGLSVAEVEQITKIRKKYINAMENNDFDVLPGGTYIKGFLRNYARLLNLDGEALVEQYEIQCLPTVEETTADEVAAKTTTTKTKKTTINWRPVAALTALLIVVGIIYTAGHWLGGPQQNKAGAPTKQITQNKTNLKDQGNNNPLPQDSLNKDKDKGQGQEKTGAATPEDNNVQVVLQVTNKVCWMRIFVDEQHAFEGNVPPGATKTFQGQESVSIRLGEAGAVRVQVNGEDYGFLGGPGQVVTKTFASADQEQNNFDG